VMRESSSLVSENESIKDGLIVGKFCEILIIYPLPSCNSNT
jgi:hypothetical protein